MACPSVPKCEVQHVVFGMLRWSCSLLLISCRWLALLCDGSHFTAVLQCGRPRSPSAPRPVRGNSARLSPPLRLCLRVQDVRSHGLDSKLWVRPSAPALFSIAKLPCLQPADSNFGQRRLSLAMCTYTTALQLRLTTGTPVQPCFFFAMFRARPLVWAHRGASKTCPENTLAAFRAGF